MRVTLTLILGCLASLFVFAKEKVRISPAPGWLYPTSPALEKAPDTRDISNGYYLRLLDDQVHLPTQTSYTHYLRQIVNESGIQNASEVSVSFAPEYQELVVHAIAIIRNKTVINQLQANRIQVVQEETDAENFQYNGLKRAFVTLKDVRKGDRIEVAYSLIGFNPVFGNKFSDDYYFTKNTAICNFYKTILTTPARPLEIRTENGAPEPDRLQTGGLLVYHWNNPPLKAYELQEHVPGWYNSYPAVAISEYRGWNEVVNWGMSLMQQYQFPLPAALQAKIAGFKKATGNDKDALTNLAIRFVQDDIRYLGLEIGPGTHVPRPPAAVFTQRFGDCKDKSLLLATILQSEGITAYVALTNTVTGEKLTEVLPSPGAFNHAIVAIERSRGQYVFIDPTIASQKGELINHYIPAYGYALVLQKGEQQVRPVELGSQRRYEVIETLDVRNIDTSRFTVATTYTGGAADNIRDNFAGNSRKQLEDSYLKYYASLFEGILLADSIRLRDDPNPLSNKVEVSEQYLIPHIWTTDKNGKRSFDVSAKFLSGFLTSPASLPANAPMELSYPVNISYALNIQMPEAWGFESDELHIKNDAYQFDFIPQVSGSRISLQYFFKTFKSYIPAAAVGQYKAEYKSIVDKLYFQLYKTGTAASPPAEGDGVRAPDLINWWAVAEVLLLAAVFVFLFKLLHKRREYMPYPAGTGYLIRGWVLVLGITIGIQLGMHLVALFTSHYFSYHTWNWLNKSGGVKMQLLLMYELFCTMFGLAGTAALLYWFCMRRDIFPKMFFWYCGIHFGMQLLLIGLYYSYELPVQFDEVKQDAAIQVFRKLIYMIIWISFLLRSQQAKATFLEPFRQQDGGTKNEPPATETPAQSERPVQDERGTPA